MQDEQWHDIAEYEGLYQISNFGRVKSISRTIDRHGLTNIPDKIMNPSTNIKGYKVVQLSKDGIRTTYFVHRLVAKTFIPNPTNLSQVNHKDEDKTNNKVDNLEWCDGRYNINYGTCLQRRSEHFKKKVCQYSLDNTPIKVWDSLKEAAIALKVCKDSISKCCHNVYHSCGGFKWKLV